jgi:hypothetical protein
MSTFGVDLVYINAGFVEEMKDELDSESDPVTTLSGEADWMTAIRSQMESLGASETSIDKVQTQIFLARFRDIQYPSTTH